MAKKKQRFESSRPDPAEALSKLQTPGFQWKIVAQVLVALLVLWLIAGVAWPWLSWWGVAGAGTVTLAALGFGAYALRLTRRSAAIVDVLKGATDAEGRKEALLKLASKKGAASDAMNALARAQLLAQEDPQQAISVLEGIELEKAPGVVQDDVRANLGMMYLMQNRVKDARPLADKLRLDRQPQPKAKAMYAAVKAESLARTGDAAEAKKLLETFDPDDQAFEEASSLLLRAQCFTFAGTKNRGLARGAMEKLAAKDLTMVVAFARKGSNPELYKMAKGILGKTGLMPRPKMRMKA